MEIVCIQYPKAYFEFRISFDCLPKYMYEIQSNQFYAKIYGPHCLSFKICNWNYQNELW